VVAIGSIELFENADLDVREAGLQIARNGGVDPIGGQLRVRRGSDRHERDRDTRNQNTTHGSTP